MIVKDQYPPHPKTFREIHKLVRECTRQRNSDLAVAFDQMPEPIVENFANQSQLAIATYRAERNRATFVTPNFGPNLIWQRLHETSN